MSVNPKPTGFIAICRCGETVGAIDFIRSGKKESGKILSEWLMNGCTVKPKFQFTWEEEITQCKCKYKTDKE